MDVVCEELTGKEVEAELVSKGLSVTVTEMEDCAFPCCRVPRTSKSVKTGRSL
jgi:hypothetical protein